MDLVVAEIFGNYLGRPSDHQSMDCSDAREAISALLDEEQPGVDYADLSAHVAGCSGCAAWRESAHTITRRVRLTPARSAPLADRALLSSIREEMNSVSRVGHGLGVTRLLLVIVAVAQIVMTVPPLILGTDREAPLHVAHEMGSFGMALAIGFLIVAWQPARARGMHALVGAAALLLLVTASVDLLVGGRTSVSDEAPHLLVFAGWVLMYRLAVLTPLEANDGWGQRILRERHAAATRPSAEMWAQLAPERDTGASAPDVERRTAGA